MEVSTQLEEIVYRLLAFPIGYYKESSKNWIQNQEDLQVVTCAKQESYRVVSRSQWKESEQDRRASQMNEEL